MSRMYIDDLPADLRQAIENAPRYVNRRAGSALVTRLLFPVSYRSLEVWPLSWRLVNGHAVTDTRELLIEAYRRFAAAPLVRGGRRKSPEPSAA